VPKLILKCCYSSLKVKQTLVHADCTKELKYLIELTVEFVAIGAPFGGTETNLFANIGAYVMQFADSHKGFIPDWVYGYDILRAGIELYFRPITLKRTNSRAFWVDP
jgi:hypothetical protein